MGIFQIEPEVMDTHMFVCTDTHIYDIYFVYRFFFVHGDFYRVPWMNTVMITYNFDNEKLEALYSLNNGKVDLFLVVEASVDTDEYACLAARRRDRHH